MFRNLYISCYKQLQSCPLHAKTITMKIFISLFVVSIVCSSCYCYRKVSKIVIKNLVYFKNSLLVYL